MRVGMMPIIPRHRHKSISTLSMLRAIMEHSRNVEEGKMQAEPAKADLEDDVLEAAVDEVIAECDGDARAAVRALIVANTYLEEARNRAIEAVSREYVRWRPGGE